MSSSEIGSSEAVEAMSSLDALNRAENDNDLQPIGTALETLLSTEEVPCAQSLPLKKISAVPVEAKKVENVALPTLNLAAKEEVAEVPSGKLPEEQVAVEANLSNPDVAVQEELAEVPSGKLPEEQVAVEANTDPANLVSLPEDSAQEVKPPVILPFPNLGNEVIQVGLAYEQHGAIQLARHEETVNNHLDTIDQLLKLNAELAKHPEGKALSEEIKGIFAGLKEKGIDFGDFDKISKEKKAELKSSANAFIDQNRTRIQQVYTKIQTAVQNMQSVTETMKRILQSLERLFATILRNSKTGA